MSAVSQPAPRPPADSGQATQMVDAVPSVSPAVDLRIDDAAERRTADAGGSNEGSGTATKSRPRPLDPGLGRYVDLLV